MFDMLAELDWVSIIIFALAMTGVRSLFKD